MRAVLLVILLLSAASCALKPHTAIPRLSMTFSLGCEMADTATTMYYIGQGKAREINPLFSGVQHRPLYFVARKWGIAGASNFGALYLEDKHPNMATAVWLINGVTKCYVATRNDRIANKVK